MFEDDDFDPLIRSAIDWETLENIGAAIGQFPTMREGDTVTFTQDLSVGGDVWSIDTNGVRCNLKSLHAELVLNGKVVAVSEPAKLGPPNNPDIAFLNASYLMPQIKPLPGVPYLVRMFAVLNDGTRVDMSMSKRR